MSIFKVFILCALICATLTAEQNDSCSPNQNSLADYSVLIPVQVLDQLIDITKDSKGLHQLWKHALSLTKDGILKEEVRVTSVHVYP